MRVQAWQEVRTRAGAPWAVVQADVWLLQQWSEGAEDPQNAVVAGTECTAHSRRALVRPSFLGTPGNIPVSC